MREFFEIVKGAPLTVLIAMLQMGGRASVEDICDLTTYTKPTVYGAIKTLRQANMIIKSHPEYALTDGGLQPLLSVEIIKNKKSLLTTTIDTKNIERDKTLLSSSSQSKNKKSLLLYEAGIRGESMINELISYKHATLEYLQAHIAKWRKEKQGIGLLVYRIRNNDPMPKIEADDRRRYVEGQFAKFIES